MNNNSIEFKNKYLKYKNKYIILKDQLFFTNDTRIKQIGGAHTKSIFPRDILQINESKTYTEYVTHFLQYLDSTGATLDDLWMIIGASNKNASHNAGGDLTRFGEEYDIAIQQYLPIDFHQSQLLALFSTIPDTEIYTLSLYGYNEISTLYGGKANIYEILAEKLPGKFSKIIYDESTTKYILDNDIIFNQLRAIEKLIALNGELYIDTFRATFNYPRLYLELDTTKKYYNLIHSIWNNTTGTTCKTIVTKDMESTYLKHNKIQVTLTDSSGTIHTIYNPKKLFQYMKNDGSIHKLSIDGHLAKMDMHFLIDNQEHFNETNKKLELIFLPEKYKIEYKNDKIVRYPNNPTDSSKIIDFYLITRIA